MSSLIKAWRSALSDKLNMTQASWEPFTQSIHLGDFGEFDNHVWQRRRPCSAWGIDLDSFAMREEASGPIEIISGTTLEITGGGAGSVPGTTVSARAHFESKDSFLLRAPSRMAIEIEDPEAFGHAVYDAAEAAGEAPNLMTYVVYGITIVSQAYFVASSDKNTSVSLSGTYEEIQYGAVVNGSLSIAKTSHDQVTTSHPGENTGTDPAVIAFKVLSWNPSGRKVQLNANT
ncbi:MAG TPA: hypothetical protein VHW23_34370 [Kofleriaceae bacterium]|jgi:hypothetical protein|nr:hypothetical protein [Kofleriaceae bacterium]